jgi:hypothetical protein
VHASGQGDDQDYATAVPAPAAALGLAGVIPFAAAAVGSFAGGAEGGWAEFALLGYGAVILSFLGGIHWGLALARDAPGLRLLGVGVLPSLVGWAGLLVGGDAGLLLLTAGFLAVLAVDIGLSRNGAAPAWFARLRTMLTVAVCLCLLLATLA